MNDIQGKKDKRNISINKVGITDLKLPLKIRLNGKVLSVSATVDAYIFLKAEEKGAHMSRFVRIFDKYKNK